jgi:hypothetical protein
MLITMKGKVIPEPNYVIKDYVMEVHREVEV